MVRFIYIPDRFVDEQYELMCEANSIGEAMIAFADVHPDKKKPMMCRKIVVDINGERVPWEEWNDYELQDGDIVEVTNDVQGVAAIIIAIIVVCVLAYVAYRMMPDMSGIDEDTDSNTQTYAWDGPQTSAKQGAPVHVVYGEHLVGGQYVNFNIFTDGEENYADMLVALCEGEISGIQHEDQTGLVSIPSTLQDVDTAKPYIKLNDTFITAFESSEWMGTVGTNTQDPLPGFKNIQTIYNYDYNVPAERPGGSWTLLYTTNAEVDEFVVKARAPSLFSVNKKGKMRNSTVKWRIRYRADGAADWTYYPAVAAGGVDDVDSWMRLSARSKSEVLTSQTIAVGTKDNYEIQVQRYSPATNATDEQNPFKTSHITEITYNNLSYPNTAMLALRVKATDQLSGSFPNIGTLVRGLKVRVPDLSNGGAGDKEFENYYWTGTGNNFNVLADDSDPVTWNGTSYITQYTSNPAYVIRDFLLNDRYGLGDVVDATDIDNSSFDTVAKKCWQKYQSKHKHTLNLTIDSQTNPGDILAQMAKVSRIFLFWSIGYIKMKYEEDEDATQLFNMSSVVEGNFSTTYIAQSKLPNILEVTYANADDGWAKDTRELVDESEWALGRPHRKITWNIKGITDTDMALREAKIMLNKAKSKRRSITFKTTLQGVACEPGDVIAFQHDIPQWGWGGRAQSGTSTTIVLDQDIAAEVISDPTSYDIKVQHDDDSIETFDISAASGRTITVDGTFSTIPEEDDLWIIGVVDSTIKEYRVKEVSLNEEGLVDIAADEHLASMYTETTFSAPISDDSGYLPNPSAFAPTVTNLTVYQLPGADIGVGVSFRQPDDGTTGNQITVSDITSGVCTTSDTESLKKGDFVYFDSGDFFGQIYKVETVVSDTSFTLTDTSISDSGAPGTCYEYVHAQTYTFHHADIYMSTDDVHYVKVAEGYGSDDVEIVGLLAGIKYYFKVYSINSIGIKNTTPATGNITLDATTIGSPASPSGLEIDDGGVGQGLTTTFNGQDCKVRWRLNAPYGGAGSLEANLPAGQGPQSYALVKDFIVQVWDSTQVNLLREEITTDQFYTYTYEKNYQDNSSIPRRAFVIKVWQRSYYNILCDQPALISVSNPAPDMSSHTPSLVSVYRGVRVNMSAYNVTDNDMDYYKIYYGYQNPPTGSIDHVNWQNQMTTIGGLAQLTKVYVRVEPYDKFGSGTKSAVASGRTDGFDFVNASSNEWTIKADAIVASIVKNMTLNASKFGVASLSAINAYCGSITSGYITGCVITGGIFQTAKSGKRVQITEDGIVFALNSGSSGYNHIRYGDNPASNASVHYGSGALVYMHHVSEGIPFYVAAEQETAADIHLYNRSTEPTTGEIGDICVTNASLKICTLGGTPGTWTVVGDQTGL